MGRIDVERREERIGRNEALFREVNEKIQQFEGERAGQSIDVLCECGDPNCIEQINNVPVEEYERVRSDSALFLIKLGHEAPDVEEVVLEQERFQVVRKNPGLPERLAEATDPR